MTAGDPEHDGGPDAEHPPSTPEPKPLDVDSAFAAIVAAWGDESPATWPAEEELTQGRHRRVDDPEARAAEPGRHQERDDDELALSGPGSMVPSVEEPEEGPEDRIGQADAFVPPEPPPLPRGDVISRLAWGGVVAGPIFMLISVIFWRPPPAALLVAALVGFTAGFVTLVARMPKHRDDDDDGAVV
ncbi:MAG TPA: hypothetical protein VLL08_29055 [Kineosporiaceae bacterium]|nr:hypothetical protein [Kineosporiaceae bacterium]